MKAHPAAGRGLVGRPPRQPAYGDLAVAVEMMAGRMADAAYDRARFMRDMGSPEYQRAARAEERRRLAVRRLVEALAVRRVAR